MRETGGHAPLYIFLQNDNLQNAKLNKFVDNKQFYVKLNIYID